MSDTNTEVQVEVAAPVETAAPTEQHESTEQTEQQDLTQAQRRAIRIMAQELELPELPADLPEDIRARLDSDVYGKLEEIAGQLNKGVDAKFKQAAELRKSAEAQEQALKLRWEAAQQTISERAQMAAIDQQLQQYEKIDWQQYADADPQGAQKAFMAYTAAKNQRDRLAQEVGQKEQSFVQQFQQSEAQLIADGQQRLSTAIKDWGEAKRTSVANHAQEHYVKGDHPLDREVWALANKHPGLVMALHDAYLYRQSMQKVSTTAAPNPQPVQKVGGKAPVAKDPDKMSTKEWMEWRTKQLAQKRA